MKSSIFTQGLDKNPANYVAQSPLTFIERAALVYPQRPAVIHGSVTRAAVSLLLRLLSTEFNVLIPSP
jgi:hypothetical protein